MGLDIFLLQFNSVNPHNYVGNESCSLYFQMVSRSEKPNLRKLGERVTSYLEVIPEDALVEIVNLDAGKGNQKSTKFFSKRML